MERALNAEAIERVMVIGTGIMGPGIAQAFAAGGREAVLVSRSEDGLARGMAAIQSNLRAMEQAGLLSAEDTDLVLRAVRGSTDLEGEAARADLVVECVIEDLPVKRALFARLDRVCPPRILLASDTSGLRITDIASEMEHPERAATTHFWNPPHLMPLVEIVRGERTSAEAVETLRAVLLDIGKRPVVVRKDVLGQLGNRIWHAVKREAMHVVQEGIATVEEVDMAISTGFGLRLPVYGALEHTDHVGVDLNLYIHEYLFPDLCNSTEPLAIERGMAERGDLGVKTGRGFYDWSQRSADEVKRRRDAFLMAMARDLYPPARPSQRTAR
jgi:3-hydroxybutyryl-CoA dehydrogenase